MSPSAYSQGFGQRRRSLSLGRYDDKRFYDQSVGRDCYDGQGSDRNFGGRRFGGRDMNRFDDSCYDEHYGYSSDKDRYNGNLFYSRRRSQSLGRRNSMSRRHSASYYNKDDFNGSFSRYFHRRPFGMNSMNRFGEIGFMNRHPYYEYFGYDGWNPRYNRIGGDVYRFNDSGFYDYDDNHDDNYRYGY